MCPDANGPAQLMIRLVDFRSTLGLSMAKIYFLEALPETDDNPFDKFAWKIFILNKLPRHLHFLIHRKTIQPKTCVCGFLSARIRGEKIRVKNSRFGLIFRHCMPVANFLSKRVEV